MSKAAYKEQLKQEFLAQAQSVFERVMAEKEGGTELTLSEIEEKVGELRFELTSKLVESRLKLAEKKEQGPAGNCPECGREMRAKGQKKRRILTSQGEIEVERGYTYCVQCRAGFFPPGPTTEDHPPRVE